MEPVFQENFPYCFDPGACNTCSGRCCTGESGNIWVTHHEIRTLADSLGLNQIDFMQQYLCQIGNRWSLVERVVEGQTICTFFDVTKRQCGVYAQRPDQCRRFPFWEYYRNNVDVLVKECPGVTLIENENKCDQD